LSVISRSAMSAGVNPSLALRASRYCCVTTIGSCADSVMADVRSRKTTRLGIAVARSDSRQRNERKDIQESGLRKRALRPGLKDAKRRNAQPLECGVCSAADTCRPEKIPPRKKSCAALSLYRNIAINTLLADGRNQDRRIHRRR